jgi:hypothetical protein
VTRQPASEHLRELTERLWTERHLLEFLLFKLVAARLILAADARRFVAPALAEVEHVTEKIRMAELGRSVAVSQVAADWDISPEEVSLSYLASHAPEPYRSLFVEHREGFLKLTSEIEDASLENRKLASAGLANIQENLDALMGDQDTTTYSPTGRRQTAPVAPRKLDRAL